MESSIIILGPKSNRSVNNTGRILLSSLLHYYSLWVFIGYILANTNNRDPNTPKV